MTERVCQCGKVLSRRNVSGCCRRCVANHINSDPAVHARRVEGIRNKFRTDPEFRAAHAERMKVNASTVTAAITRVANGKRQYRDVLSRSDIQARTHSVEARRKRGQSNTNTRLAWCPAEWRDDYRAMVRSGIKASEAKKMVLETIIKRARSEVMAHQRAMQVSHARDLASRY